MLNHKKAVFGGIIVAIVACIAVAICLLTNPLKDNKEKETITDSAKPSEESVSEPAAMETISEISSTEDATVNTENTDAEKSDATTGKSNKGETATKNVSTTKINDNKKSTSNNIQYVTDSSILLKINNTTILAPQYAYVAINSSKLNTHYYFDNSVVKAYKSPNYFDNSIDDAAQMNKAIELQKEFYWINKKMNALGISLDSVTFADKPGLSANEDIAYSSYLTHYFAAEEKLIPALVKNGTLKISESERNKFIRKNCDAISYISFDYPVDMPQDIVDNEIKIIRSLFGKDGINSYEELSAVQKVVLDEREPLLRKELGYNIHYSVMFSKATDYAYGFGTDEDMYNVIVESNDNSTNGKKTFFIKVNYDPVEYLDLDKSDEIRLTMDAVRSDYIAYKKKEMDKLNVVLNKDEYIELVKKYQ